MRNYSYNVYVIAVEPKSRLIYIHTKIIKEVYFILLILQVHAQHKLYVLFKKNWMNTIYHNTTIFGILQLISAIFVHAMRYHNNISALNISQYQSGISAPFKYLFF